LYDNMLGC